MDGCLDNKFTSPVPEHTHLLLAYPYRIRNEQIPSQAFLTALIQIFPAIFQHIQVKLVQLNGTEVSLNL